MGYKIKKKFIKDQGIIGNKNTQSDRIVCSLPTKHCGTSFRKDTKKKIWTKIKNILQMMENLLINILINCQSHKFSIFQQNKK